MGVLPVKDEGAFEVPFFWDEIYKFYLSCKIGYNLDLSNGY